MAYYRVYLLDSTDHVFEGHGIESDSDITAIAAAAGVPHNFAVEIWEGVRRVARLAAETRDDLADAASSSVMRQG